MICFSFSFELYPVVFNWTQFDTFMRTEPNENKKFEAYREAVHISASFGNKFARAEHDCGGYDHNIADRYIGATKETLLWGHEIIWFIVKENGKLYVTLFRDQN